MASASMRMLTVGWTGDQRRALVGVLDDRQRAIVRGRIQMESDAGKFEGTETADALQFLDSNGAAGYSCGIVEYVAAVLFGSDPEFRASWQAIRRQEAT